MKGRNREMESGKGEERKQDEGEDRKIQKWSVREEELRFSGVKERNPLGNVPCQHSIRCFFLE